MVDPSPALNGPQRNMDRSICQPVITTAAPALCERAVSTTGLNCGKRTLKERVCMFVSERLCIRDGVELCKCWWMFSVDGNAKKCCNHHPHNGLVNLQHLPSECHSNCRIKALTYFKRNWRTNCCDVRPTQMSLFQEFETARQNELFRKVCSGW